MNLPVVSNVAMALTFGAAFIAIVSTPTKPGGLMRPGLKVAFGSAMAIWVFVGTSHALQFANITRFFDVYENYAKVLFLPFMAYGCYGVAMSEQLRRSERQGMMLRAEHELLMRVIDTTPTGIAVMDSSGSIEFANDRAREILELDEDPDTGRLQASTWTCRSATCEGAETAGARCRRNEPLRDGRCVMTWPDGQRRSLVVNTTPINAADGSHTGVLVAIVEAGEVAATA